MKPVDSRRYVQFLLMKIAQLRCIISLSCGHTDEVQTHVDSDTNNVALVKTL